MMNKTIKCVIIDDEVLAIKYLSEMVNKIQEMELIATFTNPLEATSLLQNNPDILVLLDINMNEISGINFTKLISNKVIFTTSFPEFAADSYEYENTVDYLLKPIYQERFLKAVRKVQKLEIKTSFVPDQDYLTLDSANQSLTIDYGSINYIKAQGHSSVIYTNMDPIIAVFSLKAIEKMLPETMFIRTHKQYLVNRIKMAHINGNELMLIGGIWLPLGKAFIPNLINIIKPTIEL